MKKVKDDSLINEQEETIHNLTNVILKLEKKLKEYKNNAEKKFMAQSQMNEDNLKDALKDKDKESRDIHKYMQQLLNEKIDSANKIITGLSDETITKIPKKENKANNKPNNKKSRTQKKKKRRSKKSKKTKSKKK